ncbi:uncharacterized protein LOC106458122 isoform X1 [Limulus polyphemus]|uniref:Uncharacterized protein LOC106458122 isoform X1 n=1 Tax=Limulus polyphemus TaxID=6850 RepID=A0ABM1B1R6_LIMPO|nr:uncharacterized protein LOC106458122 isoform X1 [Limulus polyphemus]
MGQWAMIISILYFLFTTAYSDIMRKSIVFTSKTPKVFYCPQEKTPGMEKMVVMAKPLDKLCEFEGKGVPKDYQSDCYNDIDETEYACAEKHRIMMHLNPPSVTDTSTTGAHANSHSGGNSKNY